MHARPGLKKERPRGLFRFVFFFLFFFSLDILYLNEIELWSVQLSSFALIRKGQRRSGGYSFIVETFHGPRSSYDVP